MQSSAEEEIAIAADKRSTEEQRRLGQLEARLKRAIRSRDAYLETLKRHQETGHLRQRLEMPPNLGRRRSRSIANGQPRRKHQQRGEQNEMRQQQKLQRFHSVGRNNLAARDRGGEEQEGPDWEEEEDSSQRLRSLLARLETSSLFWGTERQQQQSEPPHKLTHQLELLRPFDSRIPENYGGVLLHSDLPSMDQSLAEIRQSVAQLKQFRLSMPTSDYFQSVRRPQQPRPLDPPPFGRPQFGTQAALLSTPIDTVHPPPSMFQIRSRLLNMEWHIEARIRELLDEHKRPSWPVTSSPDPRSTIMAATMGPTSGQTAAQQQELFANVESVDPPQPPFAAGPSTPMPSSTSAVPVPIHAPAAQLTAHEFAVPQAKQTTVAAAFEPIRSVVFGTAVQQQKTTDDDEETSKVEEQREGKSVMREAPSIQTPKVPQTANQETPASKRDDDFQRMLDALKNPRRKFVSSSTEESSAEELEPKTAAKTTETPKDPTPAVREAPKSANVAAAGGQVYAKMLGATAADSDSDSDFFK